VIVRVLKSQGGALNLWSLKQEKIKEMPYREAREAPTGQKRGQLEDNSSSEKAGNRPGVTAYGVWINERSNNKKGFCAPALKKRATKGEGTGMG